MGHDVEIIKIVNIDDARLPQQAVPLGADQMGHYSYDSVHASRIFGRPRGDKISL